MLIVFIFSYFNVILSLSFSPSLFVFGLCVCFQREKYDDNEEK